MQIWTVTRSEWPWKIQKIIYKNPKVLRKSSETDWKKSSQRITALLSTLVPLQRAHTLDVWEQKIIVSDSGAEEPAK